MKQCRFMPFVPLYVSEEHPEQGEAVRVSAGLGGITFDGTF